MSRQRVFSRCATSPSLRYEKLQGHVAGLHDFIGFNRWNSAAIVHGARARCLEGRMSTVGVVLGGLKRPIKRSPRQAEAAVARL